jgi:PPOX class probable F420-dependent enzyme
MRRDQRVSLCIDDEEPPFHFAIIEGTAELIDGDPDLLHWATRIGGRYMGPDRADEYGQRNAVTGELLVRVTPHKILAFKNVSG